MGADVKTLGLISIVYYGAGIIASRLFGSRLSKRFSDRAVLCAAFLLLGTYCALLPLCRMPWMVMLVQMLGGFSRNLMYTCTQNASEDGKTTAMEGKARTTPGHDLWIHADGLAMGVSGLSATNSLNAACFHLLLVFLTVGRRRHAQVLFEDGAEIKLVGVPKRLTDILHGQIAEGKQVFGFFDTQFGDSVGDVLSHLLFEDDTQIGGTDVNVGGNAVQTDRGFLVIGLDVAGRQIAQL